MEDKIQIKPDDSIKLTGELVIKLYQLIGQIPSKDSAYVFVSLQEQILENYKPKNES